MAHIAGKAGFMKNSSTEITGCQSWAIDYTFDVIDTTDFADSGTRSFLPGCSGWTGSFVVKKDGAVDTDSIIGTSFSAVFGESDTSNQNWTGDAICVGVHAAVSFDGYPEYTFDLQGTGALVAASA